MSAEPTDAQVNAAALEYFGVSATYDRERMRASLRAAAAIAEEPEWEYGERSPGSTYVWGPWTAEKAESLAVPDAQLMRRRKAGPWVPVKQEGAKHG